MIKIVVGNVPYLLRHNTEVCSRIFLLLHARAGPFQCTVQPAQSAPCSNSCCQCWSAAKEWSAHMAETFNTHILTLLKTWENSGKPIIQAYVSLSYINYWSLRKIYPMRVGSAPSIVWWQHRQSSNHGQPSCCHLCCSCYYQMWQLHMLWHANSVELYNSFDFTTDPSLHKNIWLYSTSMATGSSIRSHESPFDSSRASSTSFNCDAYSSKNLPNFLTCTSEAISESVHTNKA